jgi:hypothetical protein
VGIAVFVVVSVLLAVFLAGRRNHTHPTAVRAPLTVVEVDQLGDLVAHDLLTGGRRVLSSNAAGWPEGPAAINNRVAYVSADLVWVPGLRRPLGPGAFLVPVHGTPLVWAAARTDTGPAQAVLWNVGTEWVRVGQLALDQGERPVAAMPGRLVTVTGRSLVVRDAATGMTLTRLGDVNDPDQVLGALTDEVAYVPNAGCEGPAGCELKLADARTGADRAVGVPEGAVSFIAGGAISTDGRIAAFNWAPDRADGPTARLVVITPPGDVEHLVNVDLSIGEPVGAAAWDPTGRWLVFGGLRRTFLLDTTTWQVTQLPFTASYGFAVLSDGDR